MTADKQPLSEQEFQDIYAKVPRLTVEIVIHDSAKGVVLTKRQIEPCKGQWHLPGGTVRFAEPLAKAVERIAKRELGIAVTQIEPLGFIEYPSHYTKGLDTPVGLVFAVTEYDGTLQVNDEASDTSWFATIPKNMHADQDTFLIANGFLKQNL